ncbi:MAG TPA: DUF302 domain-containing protein [Polyangia bacterium]|nr:DUF302 domain-containing protein [Polyangia bacterium]
MGRSGSISTRSAVERAYIETGLPYPEAVKAFEAAVGRCGAPPSATEAAAPGGLMIFDAFEQGAIEALAGRPVRCRLYLVGNPGIAAQIVRVDPRACLYVPFRVAIHQAEGRPAAAVSFDRPSSSLAALGRRELEPLGRLLDHKIATVVAAVLRGR